MELALSALAGLGQSLGLSSAGAAAGGGAATAGAGSTALSALQGFGTAFAILGQLGAAGSAARQSEQMAMEADLQAGQARVDGQQKATRMQQELLRVLGENQVATAAAGIDISTGIGLQANAEAKKRAASELSISRDDADMRSALYRLKASGLRSRASSQRTGGLLGAMGTGLNYAIDLAARG
uniref:hypothetical protein n=1 Tax=Stappia sp. TaxID=1870903 RepID=UPI003BAB5BD4